MPIADETRVREILSRFTRETIPDYIIENAEALLEAGGVQKLDIQQRDQFLDVDGQVQGDDFQIYTSELGINLADGTINSYCNCPESFSGVCRHVGATAAKLLKSLSTPSKGSELPKPRTEWRQTFRGFFSTELEAEPAIAARRAAARIGRAILAGGEEMRA